MAVVTLINQGWPPKQKVVSRSLIVMTILVSYLGKEKCLLGSLIVDQTICCKAKTWQFSEKLLKCLL